MLNKVSIILNEKKRLKSLNISKSMNCQKTKSQSECSEAAESFDT